MVNLNQPFHFDVDLYFGTKDVNGADGIAFGLQQLSAQQLGFGGGIGYLGITPSIFVECDTYQNGGNADISDDHAAVQLNGSVNHSSTNNLTPPISLGSGNVEDGQWHNCIFNWDPINMLLTVEFDGTQIINLNYDIINNVSVVAHPFAKEPVKMYCCEAVGEAVGLGIVGSLKKVFGLQR